ncbi:MAG: queuosine precursor transporter [Halobacteriales archaeon]|nr:queuosine precursor transporter [Halobacteriales archaeon]
MTTSSNGATPLPVIGLIALFVTSLVVGQLLAVKVIALPLPVALPVVGASIIAPAGVLAYAVTFFASDCYAELYGRRSAQRVVNIAFLMNFVMLALLWLAIVAPGSPAGADPAAFARVLSPSTGIVIGSLVAYVVSQNWDVLAFHFLRERTRGRYLWLRNIGSTATSQALDTVIFITIAFWVVPVVLGIGTPSSAGLLAKLIVGQYLLKLLIALLDTPFVYAVVGYAKSTGIGVRQATI